MNNFFTPEFLKKVTRELRNLLFKMVDEDSVQVIAQKILFDVAYDIFENSGYQETGEYNDSDLRYAIGRTLIENLK